MSVDQVDQVLDFGIVNLGLTKIIPNQNHIGFVYLNEESNGYNICHFCWHHELKCESFQNLKEKYLVDSIKLDHSNSNYLASAYLASAIDCIAENNPTNIPYSFRTPFESFDDEE